jgi:carboxylesterase
MEWNEPLYREGSNVGVLLLHGFTGSPRSLQEFGLTLADAGLTVALPLLSGHGTEPQALARTRRADWQRDAEYAYEWLRARTDSVFVVGLSMGGALALWMAENHARLAGVVTVNACIRLPRERTMRILGTCGVPRFVTGVGNDIKRHGADEGAYKRVSTRAARELALLMDEVRRGLDRVRCPVLIVSSDEDHVVPPPYQRELHRSLGCPEKELVTLPDSYHVATMDNERKRIFSDTLGFIRRHAGTPAGGFLAPRRRD